MKNRNTAEFSAGPFCLVFLELGVHRFQKRTHEWDLERRAGDRALAPNVADCIKKKQRCHYNTAFQLIDFVFCDNWLWGNKHTLIIGNCESQETPENGPEAHAGESVEDEFDLGRYVDASIAHSRQWRGQVGIGVHDGAAATPEVLSSRKQLGEAIACSRFVLSIFRSSAVRATEGRRGTAWEKMDPFRVQNRQSNCN